MKEEKSKQIISGITVAVTILKIIVQHSSQIKKAGGKNK